MEKLSHFEQEQNPDVRFSIPMTDILKDPVQAAELWPDAATEIIPQIEQRQAIANSINQYLDNFYNSEITPETHQDYLSATGELLTMPEYERIALFLPFESFPSPDDTSIAAESFRQSYLSAWQNLLFLQDVRASFSDGDVYELDARPGDPEHVVKAAHLTPFLIRAQLITTSDILDIMEFEDNDLLSWSFLDTLPMMKDFGQVSPVDAARFAQIQHDLPERPPVLQPTYISAERQKWLDEQANPVPRPTVFTPGMLTLGEPLSSRIDQLRDEINLAEKLANMLSPEQTANVVLLGGSRLKGYGRPDSDIDLYAFTMTKDAKTSPAEPILLDDIPKNPPAYAHEIFDMIWAGDATMVKKLQQELAPIYFREANPRTRKWNTERMEQDLLEFRLLQKGYPRLCPDTNPEYKKYPQMDGQSAFYETGFRVIATKIYANSIFIPKISPDAE